jgi:hypothetical protein
MWITGAGKHRRPWMREAFPLMKRYYFDIRDGDKLVADEEGMELPDVEAAQEEAARTLADLVRDQARGRPSCHMAVEVRDYNGPMPEVSFLWRVVTKH